MSQIQDPYLLSPIQVLDDQDSSKDGLTTDQRKQRILTYGSNELDKQNRIPGWVKFFNQFKDLMILLLIVTALLARWLGELRTTIILWVIVLANAVIGYMQEAKAEKMLDSLQGMMYWEAKVMIDGVLAQSSATTLIPGDVIQLTEWDAVPADVRVISEMNLQTNDFSLTGESSPQKKHVHKINHEVVLWDRTNMCFMGTTVAIWSWFWVVTATGMQTELGKIASLSSEVEHEMSPLQKEFNHIAKRLTIGTLVLWVALFLIALAMQLDVLEALLFAIGIAASMVPQGLPAQISIALSSAAARLSKEWVLVKKLSAVETLGAVNVICTDKTGTLTQNEMTVQEVIIWSDCFHVTGVWYRPVGEIEYSHTIHSDIQKTLGAGASAVESFGDTSLDQMSNLDLISLHGKDALMPLITLLAETAVMWSNARISPPDEQHANRYCIWDPTEWALITLWAKLELDQHTLDVFHEELHEWSFDSVRKRMSSVRKMKDGTVRVYIKWAMSSVLPNCIDVVYIDKKVEQEKQIAQVDWSIQEYHDWQTRGLTQEDREYWIDSDDNAARRALRNLAFAYKDILARDADMTMEETETWLTLIGMASMIDPPREDVREAMHAAHAAHIKLVVITGDYALTARAIAEQIDLDPDGITDTPVIAGADLQHMTDHKVMNILADNNAVIFSRMSPEDKIRIVQLCKKHERLVAVTGDGVNDAPALKRADIWVSMGMTGTDVAKDASEIVLMNDSFATLVTSIQEWRTIFTNLRKTILSSMTSNIWELVAVLLWVAGNLIYGWPMAILAVQILAIDLIGEMLPLAALTYDPAEGDVMTRPARDVKQHILGKRAILDILFAGVLMWGLAFLVFVWHIYSAGISLSELSRQSELYMQATTMTYITIVLIQFANIFSRRMWADSMRSPYFWSNKKLLWSCVISLAMIGILVYIPVVATYMWFAALSFGDWMVSLVAVGVFLVVREWTKKLKVVN